jgi:glutaredoxin 2
MTMEGQTQTATPEAGAGAGAGAPPGGSFTPDKLFEGSEADYSHARDEHIKQHGPGSWERYISGLSETAEKPKEQTTPAKANGVDHPEIKDDDAEPGEITINSDGKPVDAKTGRFVPKAAYLRKAEEVKTKTAEVNEYRGKTENLLSEVVKLKERLSLLTEVANLEKKGTQTNDQPAIIDPKEDLIGAFDALMKKVAELEKGPQKDVQEVKAQLEARELRDWTMSDARSFAAKTPDFQQAMAHAVAVQEAAQVALGLSAEEAKAAVQEQLRGLIADAKKNGKSWAERVYAYAKVVGYAKAAEPGESEAEKAARAEIERINNGQAASASLRGAGGNGVGEVLTREKVAMMDENEYANTRRSYIAKHGAGAWEKFMFANG